MICWPLNSASCSHLLAFGDLQNFDLSQFQHWAFYIERSIKSKCTLKTGKGKTFSCKPWIFVGF